MSRPMFDEMHAANGDVRAHYEKYARWLAQQPPEVMAAQRQAALVETIAGLETVKAQGAQGRVQSRWERANEHLAGLTVRMRAQSSSAMLGAARAGGRVRLVE